MPDESDLRRRNRRAQRAQTILDSIAREDELHDPPALHGDRDGQFDQIAEWLSRRHRGEVRWAESTRTVPDGRRAVITRRRVDNQIVQVVATVDEPDGQMEVHQSVIEGWRGASDDIDRLMRNLAAD